MNLRWSFLLTAALAMAHPMGNFSVSHYSRLEPGAKGVNLTYVLDLAEVPTYTLLRDWKLDARSSQTDLDAKAAEQAREWASGLDVKWIGKPITPEFVSASAKLSEGAGGLSVARIEMHYHLTADAGALEYEDKNFADRAGWKEIVIQAGNGAELARASQGEKEVSKALTEYPADPTAAPPQDLRASFEWTVTPVVAPQPKPAPRIVPIEQPKPVAAPAPPPSSTPSVQQAPGTVVKGDYLSLLLGKKELSLSVILIGVLVAFGLGSAHALTPGHGKTIVAAYLVGSRGTPKHAAFLGAMVTFTHTISVFLLGLATLFLTQYVNQEKITQVLGAVSGLSIVAIGATLFWKRWKKLFPTRPHTHHHHHGHSHDHGHVHAHAATAHVHGHSHAPLAAVATHSHDHGHSHDHHHHDHHHDDHDHHHGPGGHSHVPEGEITLGSLIALGASGGLVPCPSALVILLSAIALGRTGLGLILLVAFSLGLAGVLIAIGMAVLYAKSWLPDPKQTSKHGFFRLVPVLSAGVVICLGLAMTAVSLGWIRPGLAG
jgi:nickel/cobalt transporter (NicO) family protein